MQTLTYTGELVIRRCWCGIRHAIPSELDQALRRDKKQAVHCPVGHEYVHAGLSAAQELQQQRAAADAREVALRDQLQAERRQHAATKGKLTRMRKRIAAGVCPCCTRSFRQVRQHMERMHPDEAALVFNTPR